MSKIVFDLNELKEFLKGFAQYLDGKLTGSESIQSEKIVYEIDDNGTVFSKQFLNGELNEKRFKEFIQGHIVDV